MDSKRKGEFSYVSIADAANKYLRDEKDRKAILKDLQGFGAIEIETSKAGGDGLTKMDTLEDRQKFEKRISVLEQALDVLQEKTPKRPLCFLHWKGRNW